MPNERFERFDSDYYDRFYQQPRTRASGPEEFQRVADFVWSYLRYLEVPVATVLDLGCGLGRWKQALEGYDPAIRYTGVDASPYLARRFGWTESTVEGFRSNRRYDLVICQDVLSYLRPREIKDALANMARLAKGAAYIHVVTKEDWDNDIVDPQRTDHEMNQLDALWYRRAIGRHFTSCGGGLYLPKDSDVALWELEKPDRGQ